MDTIFAGKRMLPSAAEKEAILAVAAAEGALKVENAADTAARRVPRPVGTDMFLITRENEVKLVTLVEDGAEKPANASFSPLIPDIV